MRAGHWRFAIRNFGVPTAVSMRVILAAIRGAVAAGDPVYVHCWAGIGRTGTVVGCLLREWGFDAAEALDVVAQKWQVMEKRSR